MSFFLSSIALLLIMPSGASGEQLGPVDGIGGEDKERVARKRRRSLEKPTSRIRFKATSTFPEIKGASGRRLFAVAIKQCSLKVDVENGCDSDPFTDRGEHPHRRINKWPPHPRRTGPGYLALSVS